MFCIKIKKKRRDFTGDAESSRGVDYDYNYNDDTVGERGEEGSCEYSNKPSTIATFCHQCNKLR